MSIRLYKVTGQFEGYALARGAADAVRHAGRPRQGCERVNGVTAELALSASAELAKRYPERAFVHNTELDARECWTVAQWAAAAPADAAVEADRLRAEAAACDLRAAKLRAEAEELAKIAARAQGTEKAREPEPSEANRVAVTARLVEFVRGVLPLAAAPHGHPYRPQPTEPERRARPRPPPADPNIPPKDAPAMNLKLFSEPVLSDGELTLFGLLVVGVVVLAAYVVALLALAVLFWRHGAPALCAATLILAAEVLRQTVAAVRRWPC